jgi:hypothetical protein
MKLLLWLSVLNLALIVTPLLVALPPVKQTPAMLSAAHTAATLAKFTSVALTVLVARWLWRERTWRGLALLAVTLSCVVLSRINLLEWVFPAARGAETASISAFHDIRDSDMVIGVAIEGQSRAYPVRYLAHHHMLNDQLGAAALLPTY